MTTRARAIHLKHQNKHLLCKADKIDLNRLALNHLKLTFKTPTFQLYWKPTKNDNAIYEVPFILLTKQNDFRANKNNFTGVWASGER